MIENGVFSMFGTPISHTNAEAQAAQESLSFFGGH